MLHFPQPGVRDLCGPDVTLSLPVYLARGVGTQTGPANQPGPALLRAIQYWGLGGLPRIRQQSNGRLTAAPIEGLSVTWALVHSRERALGLAAQKLVELLLEVTTRAAETGGWPGVTLL